MVDQNQAWVQVNGQPVMGGNPYDLIDNKNQVSNSIESQTVAPQAVQNVQAEQTVPVVQQPVANAAPVVAQQNIVAPGQVVQQPVAPWVQQTVPQAKPIAEPGWFTKKLISFIAKLSGQPDPQTWKWVPTAPANVAPVQAGQAPVANVPAAKVTNPFDSIMGWVTGFLDKVESKVESVAWIDLDASINKPVTPVAPVQAQQAPQAVPAQTAPVEAAPVEAVVPEVVVPDVVTPIVEVKPEIKEDVKEEIKPEIKEEVPAVEAVKTEIDAVEKNENVQVNPMSEDIQFGESKPV